MQHRRRCTSTDRSLREVAARCLLHRWAGRLRFCRLCLSARRCCHRSTRMSCRRTTCRTCRCIVALDVDIDRTCARWTATLTVLPALPRLTNRFTGALPCLGTALWLLRFLPCCLTRWRTLWRRGLSSRVCRLSCGRCGSSCCGACRRAMLCGCAAALRRAVCSATRSIPPHAICTCTAGAAHRSGGTGTRGTGRRAGRAACRFGILFVACGGSSKRFAEVFCHHHGNHHGQTSAKRVAGAGGV